MSSKKNYDVQVRWHLAEGEPVTETVKTEAATSALALKLARRAIFLDHPGACIDKAEIVYDHHSGASDDTSGQQLPQPAPVGDKPTKACTRGKRAATGSGAAPESIGRDVCADPAEHADAVPDVETLEPDPAPITLEEQEHYLALNGKAVMFDSSARKGTFANPHGTPPPNALDVAAEMDTMRSELLTDPNVRIGSAVLRDFAAEKEKRDAAPRKAKPFVPPPILPRAAPIAGKRTAPPDRPTPPPAVACLLGEIEKTYGADFARGLETVLMRPKPSAATRQMLEAITKRYREDGSFLPPTAA